MLWPGKFDSDGCACVEVEISAGDGAPSLKVTCIVDTGYSGFLLVPAHHADEVGLKPQGTALMLLANQTTAAYAVAEAKVALDASTHRTRLIAVADCEHALMGVQFLREFGLALAFFRHSAALIDERKLKSQATGRRRKARHRKK